MSQWVRLWEDMPNDPKWRVVARRASQSVTSDVPVSQVISVFVHMLVNAGIGQNWGVLDNWNDEVIAASIEAKPEVVKSIMEAMDGLILDGDRLKGWEKRQINQKDRSAERTARWRRRKRHGGDDTATSSDNTETSSDNTETSSDAEEKRIDNIELYSKVLSPKKFGQRAISKKMESGKEEFEQFWTAYRHKSQRKRAEAAFATALAKSSLETILAGVENYHRTRPSWQQMALASSWLNGERWTDSTLDNGHQRGKSDSPNRHAAAEQIFVKEDTPQWDAWIKYYRKTGGELSSPPKTTRRGTMDRGWYFPSEYPPLP